MDKSVTPSLAGVFAAAFGLLAVAAPAQAQFDTVINLPGDPVFGDSIGDNGSVGNSNNETTPTTQLNVAAGGSLGEDFQAFAGSEVNITGGTVGDDFEARFGSVVNISGGSVGQDSSAEDSVVNISGGFVDEGFDAFNGSTINISGGTVGDFFDAESGSEVNITGGSVGEDFTAGSGSIVNIRGGSFGDEFEADPGSEVNLFGTSFVLDSVPLDSLAPGQPFTIAQRDVTLSGILADGSSFSFQLNAAASSGQDFFDPGATLRVTLVPEPATLALLGLGGLIAFRRRRD